MGLITHGRIYVCIGASSCPVIVDLVIIRSSFSQKDALTPLAPYAPPPSLLPLRRRQLPIGWPPLRSPPSPLLAAGLATGGSPLRAPYNRPPLWAPRCKRVCPWAVAAPTGCCPCERHRPPLPATAPASGAGLPCGLALATAGRPLAGGLGRSLAVGGRPCMGAVRG
ncbi:hypothetical protein GW17_00006306 [Ensete ventricosum]|nr:hypothetical protein GW17_00006306 [Ensete ventricosum]